MGNIGIKHRPTFMCDYLKLLLQENKLEMIIPDKPTSKNQKYIRTKNGERKYE